MKAIWEENIIAESNDTIIVEGNHYFPPHSVNNEFLQNSELQTTCPWKGKANYYNIKVKDKTNQDAAWYYPEPHEAAKEINGYIAFWKGVEITE